MEPTPPNEKKRLPRTVVALGLVSLATDFSSEMIYPLLPAFLVALGAGGVFIGLVDGVAETTSAFMKLLSGLWTDKAKQKKPLVAVGYGIATVMRPLVAIATRPWHVLAVRFTDRIGKGIRGAPRDTLIAASADPSQRGRAFGFHRAMDNTGALIGPLIAFALLHELHVPLRTVFWLAVIPGVFAMFFIFAGVEEKEEAKIAKKVELPGRGLGRTLNVYLVLIGIFTLGNSTDFFLLLRAQDAGIGAAAAPILWALLNGVKALLGTPLSALSDRVGRRRVIVIGWIIYALVYLGFAFVRSAWQVWALFVCYGLYYAFAEGAESALVADLAPRELRGRAFGGYQFVVGLATLPASVGFGFLWQKVGHGTAFIVGAALAGVAGVGLLLLPIPRSGK